MTRGLPNDTNDREEVAKWQVMEHRKSEILMGIIYDLLE